MKWKPAGQQHDFHRKKRTRMPGQLLEHGEGNPRKHVGTGGAAEPKNALSSSDHMAFRGIVAGKFQCVVGFDRAPDFGRAAVVERPAAIGALMLAQVSGELVLKLRSEEH